MLAFSIPFVLSLFSPENVRINVSKYLLVQSGH